VDIGNTERQTRRVRLETIHGTIEGDLRISAQLRTLDDLNVVSKNFVTLHDPLVAGESRGFGAGPLTVNKNVIRLVTEIGAPPRAPRLSAPNQFKLASLRLHVGGLDVQGFVHVPRGGVAMKRIDQDSHSFLALTSALVEGPEGEFTTSFVAVNRELIATAQELMQPEPASSSSVTDR